MKKPIWLKAALIFSLLLLLFLTFLFLLSGFGADRSAPRPVLGALDLSSWDFDGKRPSLAGEWEFYWNELYTYEDFQSSDLAQTSYVRVPNVWNSYGDGLPGFGCATYRLKLTVADPLQPLSLRLDSMSTAYRLYIDDMEIASNGRVGSDAASSEPGCTPLTVEFTPPDRMFYIIVQVSNFTYARGGIWYDIHLGTRGQIASLNRLIVYKDAMLIGSLLIMALYYLSFFLVLRKDRSSKYFVLLCGIFILRVSLYGEMILVRLFPNLSFELLTFLVYADMYWVTIIIYLLADSICPFSSRFPIKQTFVALGAAATLLTAVLPIRVYTSCIVALEVVCIGMIAFTIYIVARAYRRGQKEAGLILLAACVILLTGLHDVFYQANIVRSSFGEASPVGIFFFMFIFSFILASRLLDAYEQARLLSLQLNEALQKERLAVNELVKTELSFLKAQIKPHFLYNSLGVITALSTQDPQRSRELLYDLSDYLRGSFHFENFDGVTPIANELATVRAYLSLEKARFCGRLNVEYDIDESVRVSVPLLSIQPLVENAIRHGILKRADGGTVRLSVRHEEACAVITIWDDGVGLPPEKLAELSEPGAAGSGVGLKNIQRRLILHYGYGLEIHSAAGGGTTVTIRIPG